MKRLTYIQGAFILILTNSITGILAFVYRIYLSRTIGAEGIGVYQLIMPLYSLFATLACGGVITALSNMIAEQNTRNNQNNIYKIVRVCSIILAGWSIFLSVLIVFNADFLSKYVLKDERTYISILIFTPALIFIAVSAVFKGYFYGLQQVKPPAIIDVLEKAIRLSVLVAITYILLPYGIAMVCAGAMMAMTIGELMSFLLLYLYYKRNMMIFNRNTRTESAAVIMSKVLKTALPLSVSGILQTVMDMACALMIPALLIKSGLNNKLALSLYGELTGMVFPLFFLPFIIIISLSITLVPAITTSYTMGNWTALNKKCNDALKITTVIALAATTLFIVFPYELCRIFFNCSPAGELLYWVSFSCLFEYWQITLFAIMNGLGLQRKVLENSIISIAIILFLGYILIPIKTIGIYGYIIAFTISAIIVSLSCLMAFKKIRQIQFNYYTILVKPAICFFISFFAVVQANIYIVNYTNIKYNLIIAVSIGLVIYSISLIITGTFTIKQLKNTFHTK